MSNVKNKKNQLRAVIYARYSDDNQRIESIEGQIRECTEFANEQGYTLVGTYADKARTGKTEKRVQFQKMYLDSKKDIFDVVIVYNKASGCSIPFGKEHPLFLFFRLS